MVIGKLTELRPVDGLLWHVLIHVAFSLLETLEPLWIYHWYP